MRKRRKETRVKRKRRELLALCLRACLHGLVGEIDDMSNECAQEAARAILGQVKVQPSIALILAHKDQLLCKTKVLLEELCTVADTL